MDAVQCRCMNSSVLMWSVAFGLIQEKKNAGESVGPVLSTTQLLEVGQLFEELLSMYMVLADISNLFGIHSDQHSQLVQQLLVYFPVMTLQKNKNTVIVNLHELIMQPSSLTSLIGIQTDLSRQSPEVLPQPQHPHTSCVPTQKKRGDGRPSKFPNLIDVVAEFIKQHGYQAHQCCRTETAMSCGVTFREHLYEKIPELKKHGVGKTTIAYLMAPPHKHRCLQAWAYQGNA